MLYERGQSDALTEELCERYRTRFLRSPSAGEQDAWRHSLRALGEVLIDAGLDEVEVLVELQLPLSSLRADAVLAGRHPKTGKDSYVVIELKQWSDALLVPDSEDLCRVARNPNKALLHPLAQVSRYCDYLSDFTAVLDGDEENPAGFAYLHNAKNADVAELLRMPGGQHRQLFTSTTRGALIFELQLRLAPRSGASAADRLLESPIAPNRPLLRATAEEIAGNHRFVLLDEQQVAVSLVKRVANLSHGANQKEVIIVSGGPGSGKSVIALHLLRELAREGRSVAHATGSKAFTKTLSRELGENKPQVKSVFKYFMDFTTAHPNQLDVLICDEAHRIRNVSPNSRHNRLQVEELLNAARVPVFLLDDYQVVRPNEMGSVERIREAAMNLGMKVRRVSLDGQYRNGGSQAYDTWVLRLLELESGGPVSWAGDTRFHLSVADSPEEMEELLRRRQGPGSTARMTAGFCWKWSAPSQGRLVNDIDIQGWRRPWNLQGNRSVDGAPVSEYWATDPAGFGQIGCIYTAQGFEYDWNGVIFGDDLVWRGDQWRANPSASRDGSLSGIPYADFDRLVRNTYIVLLTRGMAGTVVYSTDPETQDMLRGSWLRHRALTRRRRPPGTGCGGGGPGPG